MFFTTQEEAIKYNTKTEFKKESYNIYKNSILNGWLDEICSHMIPKQKPSGYWTYGKCKEDALNYTTKIEYLSNSSSYDTSYKNGWLDDICSHMIENKKPNGYWSFERCKEECLKYESKSEFRKNNVSAYSTSKKNKWLDDICSHMIENRKPSGYWTFERCKEEALKYNTKEEFKENNQGAYSRTYKNNWQNEICSHMEKIRKNVDYYTYDICKELSKKCKNKNEYNSLSSSAYNISIENGWINEFFPKSKITWTDILCEIEAKKYNNLNEFKENSHGAYKYSKRVGIFEKISEHFIKKTPKEYWDYQKCKNIALSCKNLLDFELNHNCAYSSSIKNDWYNDITKHLCFDFKKCQEEALKYNSITQFKQNSKIIYNYAKNNNFLNDITKHMKKIIWNKELILEEAKKYTTKKDFEKYSNRAFREMRKLNIVLETCSHMTDNNLSKNYWTKEKCQEISLKYTNRTHFRKNEPGVVRMSIKLGVYDEICSHMITLKKLKGYWTKEKCQVIALKYTNKSDFNKNDGAAVAAMYKNNWLDICSHMILNENNKPRCIYAYEFEDNSVYIGLTCNLNDRKRRHKTNGTVFEYIQKTNSKYNIIQLTDYIEQTESKIK